MPEFIWIKDENHRVYEDDQGRRSQTPNFRHYWIKLPVIGETSRSWIVNYYQRDRRVSKNIKWPESDSVCFSEEELELKVWQYNNQREISNAVSKLHDVELLKQVAKLIGYEEK